MNSDIAKFIELSEVQASIEYERPSSVEVGNNASDSLRLISARLVESGRAEELLEILDHKTAGAWVAYTVSEFPQIESKQKERCIRVIRDIAAGEEVESLGAKMWLKERGYTPVNVRLHLTNLFSGLKRMASKKIAK
jgi:hypothetical protein